MTDCALNKFTFQYHLDIGHHQVAKILVDQDSDPYVEASKFCAKHGLKSIFITIIGDAIAHQMRIQTQAKSIKKTQLSTVKLQSRLKTQQVYVVESNTMQTQLKQQLESTQEFSFTKSSSVSNLKKKDSNKFSNVFENLYQNHRQIQMKKQMIRKRSYQSIPFRPKINHLSERIVEKKRIQRNTDKTIEVIPLVINQNRLQKSGSITLSYSVSKVNKGRTSISKQKASQQKNKGKSRTKQQKIQYQRKQIRQHIASKLTENKRYSKNTFFR